MLALDDLWNAIQPLPPAWKALSRRSTAQFIHVGLW
jgi:hypothetical protein